MSLWPFRKTPTPKTPQPHYDTIDYQSGDSIVCIEAEPHTFTKQNLLSEGAVYIAESVDISNITENGTEGLEEFFGFGKCFGGGRTRTYFKGASFTLGTISPLRRTVYEQIP